MLLSLSQSLKSPKGIKAVRGCQWVTTCPTPSYALNTAQKVKGVQKKGLVYQDQVVRQLEERYPNWIGVPGLWFKFSDFHGDRYAQADWIGFNWETGVLVIVEVKLSRVVNAWWQLNSLYKPLVERVFPGWNIALLEVVHRIYAVDLPEDVAVVHSLNDVKVGMTSLMRVRYG